MPNAHPVPPRYARTRRPAGRTGRAAGALLRCALAAATSLSASALYPNGACQADAQNTFAFSVNFFVAQMGEFAVAGCVGTSPVLVLTPGVTYTFTQSDPTNWFHPLGFAYAPDGAHFDRPELEFPNPVACADAAFACDPGVAQQAPLYSIDGVSTGFTASWLADGLDSYESAFQVDEAVWAEHTYSVQLTIPVGSLTSTLFYFCHVHHGMSGKISVAHPAGTTGLNALVTPFVPATYYESMSAPSAGLDLACGTRGVSDDWDTAVCTGMTFMCDTKTDQFSQCIQAIDCLMHTTMAVVENANPVATFMDQMIPHHINAVNMAKIVLKLATAAPGFDDDVAMLMRNVVNTQNMQIQAMQAWRETYNFTAAETCPMQHTSGGARAAAPAAALLAALLAAAAALLAC
jgi:enamine deaminase RidA (YjgF/YER057c/UK114 family)